MEVLQAGHPARQKLDELQQQIAETKRTLRHVERAPLAPEDLRAKVADAVQRARADGGWALDTLRGIGDPGTSAELPVLRDGSIPWAVLIAMVGTEQVAERIVALCTAEKVERGLPHAKRKAKCTELERKLDTLERREEREVLALEAAGHTILRRGDVRPELLLAVWQEESPPARSLTPRNPAAEPMRPGDINKGSALGAPPQ